MAKKPSPRKPGELPTKKEILDYVRGAKSKIGKREIARAFAVKGGDRRGLDELLRELVAERALAGDRRRLKEKGHLPPVAAIEITGRDSEGDLVGRPAQWDEAEEGRAPTVLVVAGRGGGRGEAALGIGDRVLARITRRDRDAGDEGAPYAYEAHPLKKLERERRRLLGIFRPKAGGGGVITPVDRKELKEWRVAPGAAGEAKSGDLVRFDIVAAHRHRTPEAKVAETLGNPEDQRKISLIAVHAHGIPDEFPARVLADAASLAPPTPEGREDLTRIPLLTIDPRDARDHDDAVYAEPDTSPRNPGGHIVTVAIADVAHYVRSGSAIDREAERRGNSVYFPDRVVPMLPERISNDLCSLREGEVRPCLAVRMVFDAQGEKRSHKFMRALMRSAAKLSYQEAQSAFDGKPSEKAAPLVEKALMPLLAAYRALAKARERRGPLDLDLPERKIELDAEGRIARVHVPERLEAHRLIEEMMIQANVAAAETLESRKAPVVYRVHEPPAKEKVIALRDFLASLDMTLHPSAGLKASHFGGILDKAKTHPSGELINEVILRTQSQAVYGHQNGGHFGLSLARYAHFTSPIRRYADLLVHRALITALDLGEGGLGDETEHLPRLCEAISSAERRAMAAERETTDRLIALYLADRVGAEFDGRVSGVTRSGLFVRLKDSGADGFIPAATLGDDYFRHDEEIHALVGDRTGRGWQLGDTVTVRLVEAVPLAGALRFEMVTRPDVVARGPRQRGGRGHLRRRRR